MTAAGAVALAIAVVPAVAQDRGIELISTGTSDAGTLADVTAVSVSDDATTDAFLTTEQLVQGDQDSGRADVYVRRGGVTTLASVGETVGNGPNDAGAPFVSQDGSRVLFTTAEKLTTDDDDASVDVYAYAVGGATTLLSRRQDGIADDAKDVVVADRLPPPTAGRAILQTTGRLRVEDGDAKLDLYEVGPDGVRLLTPGTNSDARPLDANRALTHVYFTTADPLISATDDDAGGEDTYLTVAGEYKHVSRGPTPQSALSAPDANYADRTRPDGLATVLTTHEGLVAGDADGLYDVYLATVDGPVTWVSAEAGRGCPKGLTCEARIYAASDDLTKIAFTTAEPLLDADADSNVDLYLSSGGELSLVSTGPSGGNGDFDITPIPGGRSPKISPDGRGVLFTTAEALLPEDADKEIDLYERLDGVLRLISVGEIGNAGGVAQSTGSYRAGASRVVFTTATALLRADVDQSEDLYLREGDRLELVTPGRESFDANGAATTSNPSLLASSLDGTRVLFRTRERLSAIDHDEGRDLYSAVSAPPSVVAPPLGRDVVGPELSIRLTRKTFRASSQRATISAKRRRTPIGTTIEFTLSEPAKTNFSFSLIRPGRMRGTRCVNPTRRLRRAKRCSIFVSRPGALGFEGKAGLNVVRFYGRVGSRRLKPGSYAVFARAYDPSGNPSRLPSARFRIAKR